MKVNHLDSRISSALNTAKMALWEFDLSSQLMKFPDGGIDYFDSFYLSYAGKWDLYKELVHPDDIQELEMQLFNSNLGSSFINQHRVKWPDNSFHWLELIAKLDKEGTGLLHGTLQDVTLRKELEKESQDWKIRHELVTENAGIIVYDYDLETGKIQWSGKTEEVFGFAAHEIGDINLWDRHVHPSDRKEALEVFEEARNNIQSFEVYYRFKKSDIGYREMYDQGTYLEKNGKAYRMLGMISDVTEWKRSQEALIESQDRFRQMILNLQVGVGLYDPKTAPIICNKTAYELLGLTEDQLLGKAALDPEWNVVDNDGNVMFQEDFPIPVAIRTLKPVRDVVMGVYRPSFNDRVWLMVNAEPICDSKGNLLHVICTYTDFSRRKRVEEVLEHRNRQLMDSSSELRKKNHRLVEFAQIVSHNLRAPMSNIASLSELYSSGNQKDQEDIIEHIRSICNNALNTLSDINEVLKVQQSQKVNVESIDFSDVLNHVKKLLKSSIAERDAKIIEDFTNAPTIRYSSIYIESIMLNLLSNAIKYSDPKRSPIIELNSFTDHSDVKLTIRDNGLGIDLSKYGENIFKFGKTFHTHSDGKGIGLFLIKNQIQTMGDTIEISSKLNFGTTFTITFRDQND